MKEKLLKILSSALIFVLVLNSVSFAKIKKIEIASDNTKEVIVDTEETKEIEETEEIKQETETKTKTTEKKETKQEVVTKEEVKQEEIDTAEIAAQTALTKSQRMVQEQQQKIAQQAAQLAALQAQMDMLSKPVSTAGFWTREEGFWVFKRFDTNTNLKNQFLEYDGNVYWLDELGHMSVGWKAINGHWYYFGKNGERYKGWLELGADLWYYLDPETGIMVDKDTIIDGELFNFAKDGHWIKNINQIETESLSTYTKGLVKYVNNKSKLKKVGAPDETKKMINEIIDGLPKDVLARIASSTIESIFICMEQNIENRTYMRSVGYKDEDGDRQYDYLPFNTTKTVMFVNGDNPYNLYYAIGEFLAKNIKYRQQALYNTSVWKTIHSGSTDDLEGLLSLTGDNNLQFYIGDPQTSLSCAIGWFLMAPSVLKEASESAYKFILQYIDFTTGGPSIE